MKGDEISYRKLTGESHSNRNLPASDGTEEQAEQAESSPFSISDKSLIDSNIGSNCHPLTSEERRGGDSNPRYGYMPIRRFSKPLP